MSIKAIVTSVLLLFVVSSIAFMAVTELTTQNDVENNAKSISDKQSTSSTTTPSTTGRKISAYYFYNTQRCVSCKKIELFSYAAITEKYSTELENKSLEWKAVNLDESGNKHYVDDYKLFTKSLVIVETIDGKQTRWKNLPDVWNLLMDEGGFKSYVQREIDDYLKEA